MKMTFQKSNPRFHAARVFCATETDFNRTMGRVHFGRVMCPQECRKMQGDKGSVKPNDRKVYSRQCDLSVLGLTTLASVV